VMDDNHFCRGVLPHETVGLGPAHEMTIADRRLGPTGDVRDRAAEVTQAGHTA